jgi:hypothetical protein
MCFPVVVHPKVSCNSCHSLDLRYHLFSTTEFRSVDSVWRDSLKAHDEVPGFAAVLLTPQETLQADRFERCFILVQVVRDPDTKGL